MRNQLNLDKVYPKKIRRRIGRHIRKGITKEKACRIERRRITFILWTKARNRFWTRLNG